MCNSYIFNRFIIGKSKLLAIKSVREYIFIIEYIHKKLVIISMLILFCLANKILFVIISFKEYLLFCLKIIFGSNFELFFILFRF